MTFHMPAGWYEPPEEHECPTAPDCTCEQDALDARDDYLIDHPREKET